MAGLWTRRSLEQHHLVRQLEGIGLQVKYDLDQSGQNSAWNTARRWLSSRLGRDWISVPVAIEPAAENISVCSEDCDLIRRLSSIRSVSLYSTGADDRCLWFISRLPRLKVLNLKLTLLTDQGLHYLDNCDSLQEVEFTDTLVSKSAVEEFRLRHPQCRIDDVRQLSPRRANNLRSDGVRSDRVPTQTEKEELNYWLAILEAKDNIEKEKIVAKHVGRSVPEPDHPYYPHWVAGREQAPRDQYYYDAFNELGKLRLAAAVPVLERIARDLTHSEDTRCGAISALARIGGPRAIPIFLDLLGDESERVTYDARGMLKSLTGQHDLGGSAGVPAHGTPARQQLIDDWRAFWKQNADVLRPRRSSGMTGY